MPPPFGHLSDFSPPPLTESSAPSFWSTDCLVFPLLLASPACLIALFAVDITGLPHDLLPSVACLPRLPLCCRRHLSDSSPPPFGRLPSSLPPPLLASPVVLCCLVAHSAVGVTCLRLAPLLSVACLTHRPLHCWSHLPYSSPLPSVTCLPCRPLLSIACLSLCPLHCRRHLRPSTASSPPPLGCLRQASSGVRRRASLKRQRPFRSRQSVGGAALWPPDSPSFWACESGCGKSTSRGGARASVGHARMLHLSRSRWQS